MNPKTISKAERDGIYFVLIDANDGGPPMALECTSELSADSLIFNIFTMAVVNVREPIRELDPQKVIDRLNGRIPANSDVGRWKRPNQSKVKP